ncbi:Mercuric reductase [Roseibaca ekhonensis]|uniref:Mercuric reductase n=4 Tax=Alphaproteobacteria TaxID=28211 RepID=A0A0L6CQX7_9RHOB|nr:mercury(II) reductase [Roseisalinus antarcticus]KNX40045.1 Mercuric reductase [Roseovarius tolerans]SLN77954.1 Mercuric reductase [Roseisalinus antarcticus]SUZ33795.1 Mercuric reductase [Roseibaca ekhonensis]
MKDDCCTPKGDYDLAVIGAGSAGFSAAITAVEGGKRVALIGHGTIGGTCVNVGCVPSKTMIRAAEAMHGAKAARRFPGLSGDSQVTDWAALIGAKDDLVASLRQKKYAELLPEYDGVTYVDEGPARLVDGGVEVGGRRIAAPRVIVATGGRPAVPDIPGIADVPTLDSTSLMELERLPESLIFLGGGYIGVELAQMMARMGVRVTIVCRSRLLPRTEPEVSEALTEVLREEGLTILDGVRYEAAREVDDGALLSVTRNGTVRELTADHLVLTTGRAPNTEGLGLAEMGVETDARGTIRVGDDMATTRPGIYAAGDVADRDQFVYMAAYGAKLAARNAVLDGAERYDNAAMPWVVFTDPQVAGVGLTEADARDAGHDVKTSVLDLDNVPRALAARDTRGRIKLVADAQTDRLLGGVIMAPEGADSVQTLAMALKFGMTTKALGETIFPYLTTVEGLKLAAQTFDMDVAKLSCCAG